MWQATPSASISATKSPTLQLVVPIDRLYTGNTPQSASQMSGLLRGASAQPRACPQSSPTHRVRGRESGPPSPTQSHTVPHSVDRSIPGDEVRPTSESSHPAGSGNREGVTRPHRRADIQCVTTPATAGLVPGATTGSEMRGASERNLSTDQ